MSCRSMFINADALTRVRQGLRIAWFSRMTGPNDPVSQTKSNQIKPSQTKSNQVKPNQTKSNQIKPPREVGPDNE